MSPPKNKDDDFALKVVRVEERLNAIAEKLSESVDHTHAVWKKIDAIIERLITLESIIQNTEIKKVNESITNIQTDVISLKEWKESIWRFTQPAVASLTGGLVMYILQLFLDQKK